MNPLSIIQRYYQPDSDSYSILVEHSQAVTKKALEIAAMADNPDLNLKFIEEAAMLHDIGIFMTNAPGIDCHGDKHYICHGYLGRELMEKEGYPEHALVCERHVGVGITIQDIELQDLPLPKRDMQPITDEEQIVCLADKFFSKHIGHLSEEKSLDIIKKGLNRFGIHKVERLESLLTKFNLG